MNSMNDTGVVAGPASGQTSHTHRLRGLAGTGFIATLAAMVATTLAAALAQAVGVDFEVPDGGETIPLSGFAVVTGFFSVVGIVIAAALLRWSARPAERFVWTAVSLTAISLVPPLLSGANTATTTALLGLHLVAATVMIPTLARSLRTRTDSVHPGCKGGEPVLRQVAEGVLVHQSEFCQSNAIVVQGRAGVLLIDPGMQDHEMACLANDLSEFGPDRCGRLLDASGLGSPALARPARRGPRYGTARCAATVRDQLSDPGAKARVAASWYRRASPSRYRWTCSASSPPCPPRRRRFLGMALKSGSSSIKRMHRAMRRCSSRNAGFSSPATCSLMS